jgi:CRP/FNR family transcriptional regulator, cyclic AMP receptor protein
MNKTQRSDEYDDTAPRAPRNVRKGRLPKAENHLGLGLDPAIPTGELISEGIAPAPQPTLDSMQQAPNPATELPGAGFLSEVSAEHRAFLACFGKFLRPANGEILIEEGTAQEALFVILDGTLHVVESHAERPILLAAFGVGDSIGEINLFDPAMASATAIMRSDGLVWSLSRSELDAFLEADPVAGISVLRGLLRQVARRIRSMNDKLASAEQRASIQNFWTSRQH